jgi:arsenate reductase
MFRDLGIETENINYFIKPFTKNKLENLLKKMGKKPSELLRKNEQAYRDLNFRQNNYTEKEILIFMVNDPNLIQRPIIEKGNRAVLARPIELAKEIL